jgi:putative ABC transport system permease protein
MFTLTVYLLQSSLLGQIAASAPPGMPNVFLINITESDRAAVKSFLENGPGVQGEVVVSASASGRLKAIDGKPIDQMALEGPAKRFLRARNHLERGTPQANRSPRRRLVENLVPGPP